MKKLFLFTTLISAIACTPKEETVATSDAKQSLLATDSAFSSLSEKKGMAVAFLTYADSNVVEMNANEHPTVGIAAMADRFRATDNSKFLITWHPLKCEVAKSGDLGYTFGDWRIDQALPDGRDTILFGNYVSVWKKNAEGEWRYVLDAGNATPGPTILR